MGVIAFHSNRSGIDRIYAINPDGTDLRVLTNESGKTMFPKWSSDGDRLAYTADRENGTRIAFLDLNDPNPPLVWVGFAFKDTAFSWSPDGRTLAYHGTLKPTQQNDIYMKGPNHSELTPITSNAGRNESPAWSPDGRQIAFQTDRDGNWEIYVMDVDGSGPVNLTRNGSADRLPAWSPDGRMIAFTSDRDGNDEIYVMNKDGSGVKRLTNAPGQDSYPSWSPDSKAIAFESNRSGNLDLFVMNSDGSNVHNVTNNTANDGAPSWGRDGRIYLQRVQEVVRAAKAGDTDSLTKLLQEPFDLNARAGSVLHEAVLAGQTKTVEMLLEKGADANVPDNFPLASAILNHHRDITLLLLRSGANPNLPEPSPLYEASAQGDLGIMRALLEKGADVNLNAYVAGGTAPIAAIESDHTDAVELLLEHKADPSIGAKFHGYPFDIAKEAKNEKVLNLLGKYKSNCIDEPQHCN